MIFLILGYVIGVLIVWSALVYLEHLYKLSSYPNGPFPLPFIGNFNLFDASPAEVFQRLTKTYGAVFSFSFGKERVVVINAIEPTREALLKGNDFSGRPTNSFMIQLYSKNYKGIGSADFTKQHVAMRKLAYKSLHIYGNGMKNIERTAVEEMDGLVESLRKENEMPIPMHDRLITFSTNLTSQLLIGRTFEPNDPMLKKLLQMTKCVFTGLSYADDPIVSMPWLRFFYDTEALKLLKEGCQIRDELVREQLEYHAQTLDPDNPRDILDDILIQCQDEKFLREGDFNGVPDDHIFVMFSDIFLASIDTTALISRWAILFLLHHPEYQDKAYQELVDLGHEINSADMMSQELPYLRAIISETYRTAALTQLFMPHKTSVETSVGGQTIPKDTTVFFNMLSIHHDPRYWVNPDDFNPERWIDSKTGSVISEKKMSYSPFSMGSRGCLGEKMGRMDVFLCISKLLLNFKMVPDENDPPPSYKLGTAELNRAPVTDFKVIFKSR